MRIAPAHELAFRHFHHHKPAQFVACLWWCEELEVWDVIVYRIDTRFEHEEYEFVCGGVALKRFVRVIGECDQALVKKLSTVTGEIR